VDLSNRNTILNYDAENKASFCIKVSIAGLRMGPTAGIAVILSTRG
jgi:hypothetical protein